MKGERRKFVKRVNHVLKLHQGSNIDQFRVCFEFDNNHKHHIDGWIDSAISKGVKRLELDFTPTEACEKQMLYTFPHERFISIKSSVVGVSCIKSLTSLTLIYVHVTGELLEHILSNCPLLERLHVAYSEDLVTLKICSSSLRLKHLNIIRCWELKRIEIFAPNLESFGLVARAIEMHVNYAPRLLDVHVYVGAYDYLNYALCPLSSYLSQLQSLTLDFYIALISLHSLLWDKSRRERELRKVMKYPNEHLKEVEITGFVGRAIDIELTVYLLESAIKLEKLVINPRSPALVGTPWEFINFRFSSCSSSAHQLLFSNSRIQQNRINGDDTAASPNNTTIHSKEDLITCVVASIYNFFKDCEASKERKERWNKGESNGCWGRSRSQPSSGEEFGQNQNIEREDTIAELRRQVAALIEVVQRMQPPHENTDESDDSHSHFENPFGVPPRAYNRALLVEKQQTRPALRSGQWGSRSGQGISNQYKVGNSSTNGRGETSGVRQQPAGHKSANTAPKQSQTATAGGGRQQQVGTFKCFKCREPGHRSSDCRKKALMLEEVKELEHEDGEPIFDQPSNEVGGDLEEEEGLTLMMRKTLLAPKFNSEEDWPNALAESIPINPPHVHKFKPKPTLVWRPKRKEVTTRSFPIRETKPPGKSSLCPSVSACSALDTLSTDVMVEPIRPLMSSMVSDVAAAQILNSDKIDNAGYEFSELIDSNQVSDVVEPELLGSDEPRRPGMGRHVP
ncbi:hypothetical protein CMV_012567 [Castanea mollissima]|uniref:CCHC-type domain-containing protein n=1 Tax=Castanea mollissima TaxID=60419 RepID=A0A8J4RF38_9ROSI|nr:hypothetical protein CMV_012567 [Castanea mollissima]